MVSASSSSCTSPRSTGTAPACSTSARSMSLLASRISPGARGRSSVTSSSPVERTPTRSRGMHRYLDDAEAGDHAQVRGSKDDTGGDDNVAGAHVVAGGEDAVRRMARTDLTNDEEVDGSIRRVCRLDRVAVDGGVVERRYHLGRDHRHCENAAECVAAGHRDGWSHRTVSKDDSAGGQGAPAPCPAVHPRRGTPRHATRRPARRRPTRRRTSSGIGSGTSRVVAPATR